MFNCEERKVRKANNSKLKVIKGMCCSIDPFNELKEKETGVTHVIVLERVKKRPFRNSIWRVQDFDTPGSTKTMDIVEWRLWPENMSLIRYPDDMPTINNADLKAIDALIKLADDDAMLQEFVIKCVGEENFNRFKALQVKLKYYYEMRDV